MSEKEQGSVAKAPSIPAPTAVPRPGGSGAPQPARQQRKSTLPGAASVPPPSRNPPGRRSSSTPIARAEGARPSGIPRPGRLPTIDGTGPDEAPPNPASLDESTAPPAIPSMSTPLPPNDSAEPAPISGDAARRRSRRTVKIPNDAIPTAADDSDRVSDVGTRNSDPGTPSERVPLPPADDVEIRPMRIITINSDLPAIYEPMAMRPPPGAEEPAAPISVQPDEEDEIDDLAQTRENWAAAATRPEPAQEIEEIEPDRVSDPLGGKRDSGEVEVEVEAVAVPQAPSATRPQPPPAPPRATSKPPLTEDDLAFATSVDEIPVDLDEPPVEAPKKPPPPPPKVARTPTPESGPVATPPSPPVSGGRPPTPPPVSDPARAGALHSPPPPPPASTTSPESMARKRQKPWWEELFGDDYIRTMDRPEPRFVKREVDFIEESLGVEKGAVILDLGCGSGAQAVELASRGYSVVGYDLSLAMLARAADEAQGRSQKLNFLQGDMREMAFEEMFDGVYCWSTSFGYFDDETNFSVLSRAHRALRQGGMLLLDITNRDYVAPRSPSLVWFEGEGCVCMDEMHVDLFTSRLRVKRTAMFEDGRSRELEYSIRLYALHELGQLLHECGFKVIEVTGHPAHPGVFFGAESPRVIILAERS